MDPQGITERRPIRLLIAEDNIITRMGLRAVLERFQADVIVADEALNAEDAVNRTHACLPDVILLDLKMPKRGGSLYPSRSEYGVQALRTIIATVPSTRVLILSGVQGGVQLLFEALQAGAHGYIHKEDNFEGADLVMAILGVTAGEMIYGPLIKQLLEESHAQGYELDGMQRLTTRERAMLDLVQARKSSGEIAHALQLPLGTINTQVGSILAKLKLRKCDGHSAANSERHWT